MNVVLIKDGNINKKLKATRTDEIDGTLEVVQDPTDDTIIKFEKGKDYDRIVHSSFESD